MYTLPCGGVRVRLVCIYDYVEFQISIQKNQNNNTKLIFTCSHVHIMCPTVATVALPALYRCTVLTIRGSAGALGAGVKVMERYRAGTVPGTPLSGQESPPLT